MELISTVTVGSGGAASIEFTSIAADWTDLKLVLSLRDLTSGSLGNGVDLKINGSTANISGIRLLGDGSSVSSSTQTYEAVAGTTNSPTSTASTFSSISIYFANYATSSPKSFSVDSVSENNATGAYQSIHLGLYNSTATITALELTPNGGLNFAEYTSASLYGILAGSDGTTTVT
jgi:hypothetical protein